MEKMEKPDKLVLRLHFMQNGEGEFTFHLPKLSVDEHIEVADLEILKQIFSKCISNTMLF